MLDRSGLILDIFAQHARTHEGRLQVELAQLEYQLPRLTRLWTHLSRTQRRHRHRGDPARASSRPTGGSIRERIKKLKERVEHVRQQRRRPRPAAATGGWSRRSRSSATPTPASSSLLNALVGSEVALAEDKLFATLDPTSRQVKLGDGQTAIVTDTVGFIHKLPHQLVDAFRATLEEVTRADVLLEVVDAADAARARAPADRPGRCSTSWARATSRGVVALNKADLCRRRRGAGRGRRGADHRRRGAGRRDDRLRDRPAAHRARDAAREPVGRRRRGAAVHGGRAAGARPRARHGRHRVPRA